MAIRSPEVAPPVPLPPPDADAPAAPELAPSDEESSDEQPTASRATHTAQPAILMLPCCPIWGNETSRATRAAVLRGHEGRREPPSGRSADRLVVQGAIRFGAMPQNSGSPAEGGPDRSETRIKLVM